MAINELCQQLMELDLHRDRENLGISYLRSHKCSLSVLNNSLTNSQH